MRTISEELSAAAWRKSSYSNPDGGECIEVADGFTGIVPVRDSKDPHGPALVFSDEGWTAFIAGVKSGDFATADQRPALPPVQPRHGTGRSGLSHVRRFLGASPSSGAPSMRSRDIVNQTEVLRERDQELVACWGAPCGRHLGDQFEELPALRF
jgi:hypothetical protein